MSLSARIREQLLSSFRAELAEHVQTMTDGLLALEQGRVADEQRRSTLENIFRAAHSLKGAARAMNVTAIEQLTHALESVLGAMQRDTIALTPDLFTACYQALDAIQAVQAAYEAGETTPPVQTLQALADLEPFRAGLLAASETDVASPTAAEAIPMSTPVLAGLVTGGEETIRVSVSKLDALMAQLGELLVAKIRAEQRLTQLREFQEFIALQQKEWLAIRSTYGRLARWEVKDNGDGANGLGKEVSRLLNYVGTMQERWREVHAMVNTLTREYTSDTMHMALAIDELEQEIKRTRMLPLSTITGPFGRMVRDLAQEAGKEAVLQIVGGETELDKQVLEQIKDPLIHLLRNAIDHGIESPERRVALGKLRAGTITLTAEQRGQDVIFGVSDDGAGLDLDAIRQAAVRQGQVDAASLSEAELVDLIFNVGVTTKPIVTDISGRGVGLSVVQRSVETLHGHTLVDWMPGAGTTFTLVLPLTLASSQGLLVRVSGQLFVIPLHVVAKIMNVSPQEISPLEGRDMVRYNGHPITLVRLGDVLALPRVGAQQNSAPFSGGRMPVIIVAAAEHRLAFAVDELVGEQEVVIKGLGKQLVHVGGIAGATVLGTGETVLILNTADLIKLAMRGQRRSVFDTSAETVSPRETRAQRHILIVDDSITTRMLEKNILEAVGYNVQVATDGQEALRVIATEGVPDLVVSDILMPRMDGFKLTQRIKGDPRTAAVPVILVTSLESPTDKEQGIEVGADAYIVKSGFDQNNLLETIEQLI